MPRSSRPAPRSAPRRVSPRDPPAPGSARSVRRAAATARGRRRARSQGRVRRTPYERGGRPAREQRLAGEPVAGPGQQGVAGGLLIVMTRDVGGVGVADTVAVTPARAAFRRFSPARRLRDSWTRRSGAVTLRCLASSACAAWAAAICSLSIRFCARSRSFSSRSAPISGSSSDRRSRRSPRGSGVSTGSGYRGRHPDRPDLAASGHLGPGGEPLYDWVVRPGPAAPTAQGRRAALAQG